MQTFQKTEITIKTFSWMMKKEMKQSAKKITYNEIKIILFVL